MPEITKEEIMGKNPDGLEAYLRKSYDGEAYAIHLSEVDEIIKSSLHIGQKVIVTYDWIYITGPPSGTALKMRIVEE
ncbi:hypothetical protein BTO28_01315 [Domibacillus epiphyticus]|uniref:Uncharacterized protein n=2 Tax=Domibacillus epiphyticus TaxID=1714355 RepID=A0A1V2ACI8_9BACI|nr:hypothetical protein BTO28_01315 [Domibacillus epiphyticus]